jgi:hypothetical protein
MAQRLLSTVFCPSTSIAITPATAKPNNWREITDLAATERHDGTPRYGIAQGGMPRFDFAFYRQLYSSNSAVSRLPAVQPFWWFERLILTDPEGIGGKK